VVIEEEEVIKWLLKRSLSGHWRRRGH